MESNDSKLMHVQIAAISEADNLLKQALDESVNVKLNDILKEQGIDPKVISVIQSKYFDACDPYRRYISSAHRWIRTILKDVR